MDLEINMEFASQHVEAIAKTVRTTNKVEAQIFDDKINSMGTIIVSEGVITVRLDYYPLMVTNAQTGSFLMDSINLGLLACWKAKPEAFRSEI